MNAGIIKVEGPGKQYIISHEGNSYKFLCDSSIELYSKGAGVYRKKTS